MENLEIKSPSNQQIKPKWYSIRRNKQLVFYVAILALPILQYCVMSIYLKVSSVIMSFEEYGITSMGDLVKTWTFKNYQTAFHSFIDNAYMLKNSLIAFICITVVGLVLSVIFSYYIYKKYWGSKLFMILLFIPQVVAGVVFGLLYMFMCTDVYMGIAELFDVFPEVGLLDQNSTRFPMIVLYSVWMGIPAQILMFVGGMSGINESVVEYGQIDGVTFWSEFWYITIPMIYPTLVTFIIVGLAGFFTGQMNLYTFYRDGAPVELHTNGYFLYLTSLKSDIIPLKGYLSYSELSAYGMICSVITITVTFGVKYVLNKYGPSTD